MALKVFAIALMLFLAEIVFLTTKDFKDGNTHRENLDFTDISFENIHSYLVTKEGCDSKLEATQLLKYKAHVEVYDVKTEFLHKNQQNNIQAKKAILKGDLIHLIGDVNYENNASLEVKSEDLVYNTKTKISTTDTSFILTSDQGSVKGENFIYDQINGTIKAQNIHYKSAPTKSSL